MLKDTLALLAVIAFTAAVAFNGAIAEAIILAARAVQ